MEQELFDVQPFEGLLDFSKGFVSLFLKPDQKKQISAFLQHLPSTIEAGVLSQCYIARFPDGIPHALTQLKQGGFMSMYKDPTGKFTGTASLYSLAGTAAYLNAFQLVAAASGQYYLSQINNELKMIRMNIDKILEFLYGDKKAELMAEVSFVKYAYENFSSIVSHEAQRVATITSLQESKKIAMKDIEFYIHDLDAAVKQKDSIDAVVNKAKQIQESLSVSMQLYGMSSILEIFYSENRDADYISYLEKEILFYIDKCEKRMLSSFSLLSQFISDFKPMPLIKVDKSAYAKDVKEIIESLNSGEESPIRKSLRAALKVSCEKDTEYYLKSDGSVYVKAIA